VRCRHLSAMAKKPPAVLHDPQLPWAVTAVNAPVVEGLLFRGALLTGLLYILRALRIGSDLRVLLGVLFAAGPPSKSQETGRTGAGWPWPAPSPRQPLRG